MKWLTSYFSISGGVDIAGHGSSVSVCVAAEWIWGRSGCMRGQRSGSRWRSGSGRWSGCMRGWRSGSRAAAAEWMRSGCGGVKRNEARRDAGGDWPIYSPRWNYYVVPVYFQWSGCRRRAVGGFRRHQNWAGRSAQTPEPLGGSWKAFFFFLE